MLVTDICIAVGLLVVVIYLQSVLKEWYQVHKEVKHNRNVAYESREVLYTKGKRAQHKWTSSLD